MSKYQSKLSFLEHPEWLYNPKISLLSRFKGLFDECQYFKNTALDLSHSAISFFASHPDNIQYFYHKMFCLEWDKFTSECYKFLHWKDECYDLITNVAPEIRADDGRMKHHNVKDNLESLSHMPDVGRLPMTDRMLELKKFIEHGAGDLLEYYDEHNIEECFVDNTNADEL